MPEESFYAHSTSNPDKQDWQRLADHLISVGELAYRKAQYFGGGECAELAGLLHDLGKYTDEFQGRLSGDLTRVDHATHGAIVVRERYGMLGALIAYGIAGHHAGLPNGLDGKRRSSLKDRLRKELPVLLSVWEQELSLRSAPKPPDLKAVAERRFFQYAFFGRMLFSTLVDADYLDTEAFYARTEGKILLRDQEPPSLYALKEQLDHHLNQFDTETLVNKERARILQHVRKQAPKEAGLFSLNVPTGGGKTLSSLAFALDHAIHHGLRRVIYVIPFTSIVEQNAAVFRDALGKLGEDTVLEHHSAFRDDTNKDPQAREKLKLAMENWDAPIVVTTAVQFFESLFADRPSKCRKLHNITGSVVILDEAQTLPLKLLRPCVAAMNELALNYQTSLVLCTATQPALQRVEGFEGGLEDVRELAPEPQALHARLNRVSLHHRGTLTDEALVAELKVHPQVLCIVNNRRHARFLYEAISQEPGARHLTTLMCAKHRSDALAEIRQRLHEGKPCRLISTSLIEAGVDVDFPAVYRAEAGLDSIAQAAGRCNREGRWPPEESNVSVFGVGSDWSTPPELKQFAQAARAIFRRYGDDVFCLEAINDYFAELYWQKGAKHLDAHDLLGLSEEGQIEGIPYETIASKFRMIESVMLPVIVPYDAAAKEALRGLKYAEHCGSLARALQPYLVQVPEQGFRELQQARAIEAVQPDRFGTQFMELVNQDLYHPRYGLNWDNNVFINAERSVI
ncbi:CRISPR-associated endonuclease Cas3'' [Marinobacter sp. F4216]|uniref:CRISPR-associated endonuclease Cas3'' n=1 Tax=Marinobacter sp. F4216 TaxID=2874281 RepID=UPI001CBA7C1F|nr:CRISPR-associated endonuclease Cas3'' [Marinobacter sp. F4216]MBZ2168907.1 CRISPR-associated endonuclease Cas3'' [Marinobacter sp. F4216]